MITIISGIFNNLSNFYRMLIIISIGAFLYGISIGIDFVVTPLLFDSSGLSKTLISIIIAAELATTLIVAPLLPKLISKFGLLNIVLFSAIIRNVVILFIPFGSGFQYWFITMFLFGAGGCALFTSLLLWVNNISDNKNRGMSIGIVNAALSCGIALSPILLNSMSSLAIHTKFSNNIDITPFILSAILCSISLIPLIINKKMVPEINSYKSIKIVEIIKKSPLAAISGMMVDMIFFSFSSFTVIYAINQGLSSENAKFLITAMLLGGIIFDIPVGILSDKLNRRLMMFISASIILFCSILLNKFIHHEFIGPLLFMIICGAMSGIYTSSLALIGDKFKDSELLAANSAFALVNCLGAIIGIMLTGIALDFIGKNGLPIVISFITMIYMFINLCFGYIKIKKDDTI